MNLVIFLSYCGEGYNGFQKQKKSLVSKVKSIQSLLEKKLSSIFQQTILTIASGRTDTGVSADEQVVTFTAKGLLIKKIPLQSLKKVLNNLLPQDIRVLSVEVGKEDFHPRYHAQVRVYRYSLIVNHFNHIPARELKHSYLPPFPIQITQLEKYFKIFEGQHDFTTFSAKSITPYNKVRKIYKIDLINNPPNLFIDIYGNAFLRSMIRSIIGNVLFVYRRKYKPLVLRNWMDQKNPVLAKHRVPAHGLTLKKVFYTSIF